MCPLMAQGGRYILRVKMSMKRIAYLKSPQNVAAWNHLVLAFDRSMDKQGIRAINSQPHRLVTLLGRAIAKTGFVRSIYESSKWALVLPMMGCTEGRLFPVSYLYECIPYVMDCWPSTYQRWERFLIRNRIHTCFFTARQSAERFAATLPQMNSLWLGEAVDPMDFNCQVPLTKRKIHVLELGRKWDAYHDKIAGQLARHGWKHVYEEVKGRIVFPGHAALANGLADSVVSICVPQSITHPETAGGVTTVTLRYFETMASKCIPVGICPQELRDMFGYNPLVEIHLDRAFEQMEEILANPARYQDMVDRNYKRLLQVGTWDVRAEALLGALKSLGYDISASTFAKVLKHCRREPSIHSI